MYYFPWKLDCAVLRMSTPKEIPISYGIPLCKLTVCMFLHCVYNPLVGSLLFDRSGNDAVLSQVWKPILSGNW